MKKRVLIVDDSLTVRAFEKLALGAAFEFLEAADGRAALDLAKAQRPDLILLDVVMPVMGGMDALKELRSAEPTRGIPVIMVTTRSEPDVQERCRDLGVSAFVLKPIDREQLRQSVAAAFGG